MKSEAFEITAINMHLAEDEWPALTKFDNALEAEMHPHAPLLTLDEMMARWRATPDNFEPFGWVARCAPAGDAKVRPIIAYAVMVIDRPIDKPLAIFGLAVLPEFRRRGLGRRLLACVAERAQIENREVLWVTTHDTVPAGRIVLERVGGTVLSELHTNQLDLKEHLDCKLLDDWEAAGAATNTEFEILFCDAPLTDDQCSILAEAEHGIYHPGVPYASLDPVATLRTIDQIRAENEDASGVMRDVAFVKQRDGKVYAGCTIVRWNRKDPEVLLQGSTGILPEFRRRGMGRWLKAAMLKHCLERYPSIHYVRTSNADRNNAILAINNAMGFKPLVGETRWQLETSGVLRYVAESAKAEVGSPPNTSVSGRPA